MQIKFIQDEDFTNYKKCSLFIGMPFCSFKCEKDCGIKCCQNSELALAVIKEISSEQIIEQYTKNMFTNSVVFGGLEPLDSFDELLDFITKFREVSEDDIVIYTGYVPDEVFDKISTLKQFKNIIVKFGRFIPNSVSIYDEVLGVELASNNQYAIKIS